jgi:hypothetical protein
MKCTEMLTVVVVSLPIVRATVRGQEASAAASAVAGHLGTKGPALAEAWVTAVRAPFSATRPLVMQIAADSEPPRAQPHRGLRFTLVGTALGGIIGAIWIGEAASTGTSEASLTRPSARIVGGIVGVVGGAISGALIHVITKPRK